MRGVNESTRRELEAELSKLRIQEDAIDAELRLYFSALSGSRHPSTMDKSLSFDSSDLNNNIKKIEKFSPCFEAMGQESKRLAAQVADCRQLSDRLSMIVRRLDIMQIRAHEALACTEDIINLKDSKGKMVAAMEEGNLPLAVSFIRQVHDIDAQAAKASDDFGAIQQTERELHDMVQSEFAKAIEESNIERVMSLCPLLQTLGLETEARDTFLTFIEKTVFIAVSADIASTDAAVDAVTGYAQALSNVFNSTFLIFQQYLPIVIQGMGNSLGDIHFIRKLHTKCETESGTVLTRYLKFRNVKDIVTAIKGGASSSSKAPTQAEIHVVLDELALLIQYCCMYSKYLQQLCVGAEARKRQGVTGVTSGAPGTVSPAATAPPPLTGPDKKKPSSNSNSAVTVFPATTEFDKTVDELVNRYYMEGEQWLMRSGIRSALPGPDAIASGSFGGHGALDECFFILQRCSQRAIATNNIHAACAVLRVICDMLSSDLLGQVADLLTAAATKINVVLQDHMSRYIKGSGVGEGAGGGGGGMGEGVMAGANTLSQGLQSAMSIASSITRTNTTATPEGKAKDDGDDDDQDEEEDPWGVAHAMEAFNVGELCGRYIDRLAKDVATAGNAVFQQQGVAGAERSTGDVVGAGAGDAGHAIEAKAPTATSSTSLSSSEKDRLKLCREDFEASKLAFKQTLRHGAERLTSLTQAIMKEVLVKMLGRSGPMGGVKFDVPDDKFDAQPALGLLPKALVTPFETLVNICTSNLSDGNKEMMMGLLADACCERLEHFISQTTFRFAGALKFEECVRALSALFARLASAPIRGKFSRLREVMLVLTSDVASPNAVASDTFSHLTTNEILAFMALRMDGKDANSLTS